MKACILPYKLINTVSLLKSKNEFKVSNFTLAL